MDQRPVVLLQRLLEPVVAALTAVLISTASAEGAEAGEGRLPALGQHQLEQAVQDGQRRDEHTDRKLDDDPEEAHGPVVCGGRGNRRQISGGRASSVDRRGARHSHVRSGSFR